MLEKINFSFFENIKTPEISYILGILWADGCISKRYGVMLWLKEDDIEDIEEVFQYIGEWGIYYRQLQNRKKQKCLSFSNKIIHEFLIENDYDKKSFVSPNKILYKIPDNLKHYFFRGYFDGDGCFFLGKNQYQMNITSSYIQDWSFIDDIMVKLGIKNYKVIRTDRINNLGKQNKTEYSRYM